MTLADPEEFLPFYGFQEVLIFFLWNFSVYIRFIGQIATAALKKEIFHNLM